MSTRRFPVRLIQLLSLVLCYSLLFSTLLIMKPQASLAGNSQGQAGPPVGGQKVDPPRPIAGPPGVGLPNTDAVLRRPRLTTPIVQPAIPSVQRRYRHPRLSNSASLGGRGDIGDAEGAAAESVQPVWRQSNSTGNSRRKVAQEGVRLSHSRPRRARSAGEDAHAPSAPVMLPQGGPDFPAAMLSPTNRTGGSGEDLLSGNFRWSLGILGLSGRAGLDLGLGLSYNSLATWVRSGNFIDFDYDNGFPTPGFRLAFPVVDGYLYYNSQAGAYYYLLFTPSGQRVELRRTATANVYEAVDSSYLQLTDYGSYLILRSTDGSQCTMYYSMGQYRCTEIKDRNGNFITINYNSYDTLSISTITDTLGRTVNFNYDVYGNLSSITQPWTRDLASGGQATETHQWASFSYGLQYIGNSFSGLTTYGPVNQNITVLTAVNLPDGSQYSFDYNNYGQVTKITCKWSYGGTLSMHNYVT